MIYTITFNPSLDISGEVDELKPNEKSYVHLETHTAGGNGINAGIIAHRLGRKVLLMGFLGGPHGKEVERILIGKKIPQHFVKISGHTRTNITIANKSNHQQTRLSFPGPEMKNSEMRQLFEMLKKVKKNDLVLIGGSLPPGVDFAYVKKIIAKIHKRDARCVVDMPGKVMKNLVSSKPYFIKPNLLEFQELVGKKVDTIKALLPLARKLNRHIPWICVSSIEGGALLVTKDRVWFGKIPNVKIRSTVGAGDSMVGAMSSLWDQESDIDGESLLRIGLAGSCATLTERGLTLGSKKSILKYKRQIKIKEL